MGDTYSAITIAHGDGSSKRSSQSSTWIVSREMADWLKSTLEAGFISTKGAS